MAWVSDAVPTGLPSGANAVVAVFLGASTGGPAVVERILRDLPRTFPVPIAVCQHMSPGFTALWAERLDGACSVTVTEARYGQKMQPGSVYIAPVGRHMRFRVDSGEAVIVLDRDFCDSLHVPSIDMFMSSAAQTFGSRSLGVLLTGLGSDGALGMLAIRRAGGHTMCQSPASSVAPSMPSSAMELGAVAEECEAEDLSHAIARRVSSRA